MFCGRGIFLYDLDIRVASKPFRHIFHITGCKQAYHTVCSNVHHDSAISLSFPKCEIINTHFCYGMLFREAATASGGGTP